MMQNRNILTNGKFRPCMHGASCVKYGCTYAHPSSRPMDCPDGENCMNDTCKLHHPRSKKEIPCRFGSICDKIMCPYAHPDAPATMRFRKACMHGAFCVKFGCAFAHPPGRREECTLGVMCNDDSCTKIHPRPKKMTASSPLCTPCVPKFIVGQQVQAQYSEGSMSWRLATVHGVSNSFLSLQFSGWDDVVEIPLDRIRDVPERKAAPAIPPGFGSIISRGAAVLSPLSIPPLNKFSKSPISPPRKAYSSPRSPLRLRSNASPTPTSRGRVLKANGVTKRKPQSENLNKLTSLKNAAVLKEDFLLAAKLKKQIDKVLELETQKASAVDREDFLLAMKLKKEIAALTTAQSDSCGMETKQEEQVDEFSEPHFSLFASPVKPIHAF